MRLKMACLALQNNQIAQALDELHELYASRDKIPSNLQGQVRYYYAMALNMANRHHEAIDILERLRDDTEEGFVNFDPAAVAMRHSHHHIPLLKILFSHKLKPKESFRSAQSMYMRY